MKTTHEETLEDEEKISVMIYGGVKAGAREHALVKLALNSPMVEKVYYVGGNAGIARMPNVVEVRPYKDYEDMAVYCHNLYIDLVIIGPEEPLSLGLTDVLRRYNIDVFGPDWKASQLEASKSWAVKFMHRYNIPTADTTVHHTLLDALKGLQARTDWPVVVKYDGLMKGKGVTICHTLREAREALAKLYHAETKACVLLQEYLPDNPQMARSEISVHVVVGANGSYKILPTLQDYKPRYENDVGPMTGGMGCFGPVPGIDMDEIETRIIKPTIKGLLKERLDYRGVIFFGIKICPTGPKVIEYNVRFGDPEMVLINELVTNDLIPLFLATALGKDISQYDVEVFEGSAVGVVMVSKDYPEKSEVCRLPEHLDTANTYHGGTRIEGDEILADGGRIVVVTSRSVSGIQAARGSVYYQIEKRSLKGLDYRRDIAKNV